MAEQWIPAATARSLITTGPLDIFSEESLFSRANAGLVRSRARLLLAQERREEDANIPPRFWGAVGRKAHTKDWRAGDFSAFVTPNKHWQTFGVTLVLSDVLELLPAERRSVAARQLSVASNPAWVTARAASVVAFKAGIGRQHLNKAILDQAQLGFVTGRAVLAQRFDGAREGKPTWEEREWDIPSSFWREFQQTAIDLHDWELGQFAGIGPGPNGVCRMKLSGVHFLADSLDVLLPASARASTQEAPPKSQGKGGGQPARAFWDEMLCDIWALIYQGTFTPKLQKDVEVAMLTWAERKGEKLSEATARPKAKMLFERYKHEAENFLAEE